MNKLIFLLVLLIITFITFGCINQDPVCGDEICSPLEMDSSSPYYCPIDCASQILEKKESEILEGTTELMCGNAICQKPFNSLTCPQDCPSTCGNGICEEGENVINCPQDCRIHCSEESVMTGEFSEDLGGVTCKTLGYDGGLLKCASSIMTRDLDFYICTKYAVNKCFYLDDDLEIVYGGEEILEPMFGGIKCISKTCGDGVCAIYENFYNCPEDCSNICGNNVCEEGQTCENCPWDCGECP